MSCTRYTMEELKYEYSICTTKLELPYQHIKQFSLQYRVSFSFSYFRSLITDLLLCSHFLHYLSYLVCSVTWWKFRVNRRFYLLSIWINNVYYHIILYPVSYTHLDVYKRQVQKQQKIFECDLRYRWCQR